jgi:hypothetical protein
VEEFDPEGVVRVNSRPGFVLKTEFAEDRKLHLRMAGFNEGQKVAVRAQVNQRVVVE